MPVDERTRRVMTDALVRVFGEEVTDTLLAHLPPVGWADVATKQDLEHLADRLRAEFHREIRQAVTEQAAATQSQTRTLMLGLVGSNLTVAVIAFGAARLV